MLNLHSSAQCWKTRRVAEKPTAVFSFKWDIFFCNRFFNSPQSWMSLGQTGSCTLKRGCPCEGPTRTLICPVSFIKSPEPNTHPPTPLYPCQLFISWKHLAKVGAQKRSVEQTHQRATFLSPDKLTLFVLVLSSVLCWGGVVGEIVRGILWHVVRTREDATSVDRR